VRLLRRKNKEERAAPSNSPNGGDPTTQNPNFNHSLLQIKALNLKERLESF
jgi:hypothetical protein